MEWTRGPVETHVWTQADLDRLHDLAVVYGDVEARAQFGLASPAPGVVPISQGRPERPTHS